MSVKHTEVFGITENVAKGILETALSTGGDFAEVYIENSANEVLLMRERKLANANASEVMGAAVRVIKDGKLDRPITLFVVSGNFYEMMNDVAEIGNDIEKRFVGVASPTIKIGSLAISGK